MTAAPSPARRVVASLAAALLLAGAAGCGDSDGSGDDPSTDPTVTDDGLTAPGTRLSVGDTATVPRTDGTAVIELTVTGVTEGTSADLEPTGLADAEATTPFYVEYEMTVVSGNAYGMDMRHYLSAWAEGEQVGELVNFKRFPTCQEVNFPQKAVAGTTVTSCRTFVTDTGDPPVDSVHFDNDDGYDGADDTALEWTE